MEGLFETQDEVRRWRFLVSQTWKIQRLDNPLVIPHALSFLTYRAWTAQVKGLDNFPRSEWPDSIPILYYSYHVMVGLGTLFIGIMIIAVFLIVAR